MKFTIIVAVASCIFITSCAEKRKATFLPTHNSSDILEEIEIPNRTVDISALSYDNKKSLYTINDELYTGFAVSYYQDGTLKEKTGIAKGRRHHKAIRWYPDGHLKEVANYHQGKLHGEKKRWSTDSTHILITHLNYHLGKAHGEQKQWYPTGELYKKLNLHMGIEEGIQQAYRENGALYANYEAKNGRIFGLKKAMLCYGLEDENIKYED